MSRSNPEDGKPPVDSQMAMYGYFQHGWDTPAKPAAPAQKAAPAKVQRAEPSRPAAAPRFRGIFDALFGRDRK